MCIHLRFDHQKATQAIGYFVEKAGGIINKLRVLKLVYFADRYHLRKYGRLITNDEYFAMPYGPVASGVKDIAELSDFLGERELIYASQYLKKINSFTIGLIKPYEQAVLSETDHEALLFAWEKFGQYSEFELSEITHKYPEWEKHKQSLEVYSRIKMNLEDFIEDSPDLSVEQCYSLSAQEKIDTVDELKELSHIEALWN
jgi:uncharacterized phage-associated protein